LIEASKPKASDSGRRLISREFVLVGGLARGLAGASTSALAFVSGINAADRDDPGRALPEWVEQQTEKIFANLDAILEIHDMTRRDIVSVRIHLAQFERLQERLDRAYLDCMSNVGTLPARSCVGVAALARGALVEMDFVLEKKQAA
jgi:2-iminobutanoate/2-iminopropanoate deaminase